MSSPRAATDRRSSPPAPRAGSFDTFNQAGGVSGSFDRLQLRGEPRAFSCRRNAGDAVGSVAAGRARIDDYDDNLTASTKLGYDITRSLRMSDWSRATPTRTCASRARITTIIRRPTRRTRRRARTTPSSTTRGPLRVMSCLRGRARTNPRCCLQHIKSSEYSPTIISPAIRRAITSAHGSNSTGRATSASPPMNSWCSAPNISAMRSRRPSLRAPTSNQATPNCNPVSARISSIP